MRNHFKQTLRVLIVFSLFAISARADEQVILSPENCDSVLALHRDPSHVNPFRWPLYCDTELRGVGTLFFPGPTEPQSEMALSIEAALYNPNDGGSEIAVSMFQNSSADGGISVQLRNSGVLDLFVRVGNALILNTSASIANLKTSRVYIVRSSLQKKTIAISFREKSDNTNETLLATVKLTDHDLSHVKGGSWSYHTNNNALVKTLKMSSHP